MNAPARSRTRLAAAGLLALAVVLATPAPATAADSTGFDPGHLISDELFYSTTDLTADEIQAFFDSRRAYLGHYRQAVPDVPADEYCTAIAGGSAVSAAEIIKSVSVACGIGAKVIIVLLQKEQSLATARRPSAYALEHATGFLCPDSAACDPAFAGFFYQVYYAARQFRVYLGAPEYFNFHAGGSYEVLWSPNHDCGTTTITMSNAATAGLYNYTPYTPNRPSVENLYGTGDACSSYGNRNFWRLYADWFGPGVPLERPAFELG